MRNGGIYYLLIHCHNRGKTKTRCQTQQLTSKVFPAELLKNLRWGRHLFLSFIYKHSQLISQFPIRNLSNLSDQR
jgi:hypothetical protein